MDITAVSVHINMFVSEYPGRFFIFQLIRNYYASRYCHIGFCLSEQNEENMLRIIH